ncbi:hypothetical protein ACFFIX_23410 [Metabacillus herbersteinensis]|uniref:Uncharacterized protein n=1 Tax=Metabacillus herbersteinensis TaxID=283816 RepID=A0ABV6GMF7_9BACI
MQLSEYLGQIDYEIIQFTFSLIKDVDSKIHTHTLFYKNQVLQYVQNEIDCYIKNLQLKRSLKSVYKIEMQQLMSMKLRVLFDKHSLLQCM